MFPTSQAVWSAFMSLSFCVPLGQPACLWSVPGVSEHLCASMCAQQYNISGCRFRPSMSECARVWCVRAYTPGLRP